MSIDAAWLDTELYDITVASRYLDVPNTTLQWWLDGDTRSGTTYKPVIREQPTGSRTLTWGEFVEAWYVRQYRREHKVRLAHLRSLISALRDELGVAYPLAYSTPLVAPGRKLVQQIQNDAGVPQDLWIVVADNKGQLALTPTMTEFYERVQFDPSGDRSALAIRPRGPGTNIVIQPDLAFGAPHVNGIRTESLVELVDAGDDIDDVAHDFDLDLDLLKEALSYEWEPRPLASA
jgi:uncharacterized protein (DUF433 family)